MYFFGKCASILVARRKSTPSYCRSAPLGVPPSDFVLRLALANVTLRHLESSCEGQGLLHGAEEPDIILALYPLFNFIVTDILLYTRGKYTKVNR